jgi:ankyrin repeat protein
MTTPFPTQNDHKQVVSKMLNSEDRLSQFDWHLILDYLHRLPVSTESNPTAPSNDGDPTGRGFILRILAKKPPTEVTKEALAVFPDSLVFNVSAFFVASRNEDADVIRQLLNHVITRQTNSNEEATCPYSWIQMSMISVKTARILLTEYPEGVLQRYLNSDLSLLDTVLLSCGKQGEHDSPPSHNHWWAKLELMLQIAQQGGLDDSSEKILPVHTVLRRILSRPELLQKSRSARHIVCLLHQMRLRDRRSFGLQDKSGSLPLHFLVQHKCTSHAKVTFVRDIIALLIEAHPRSARTVTSDGRLPIHLALENGWPGFEEMLNKAPESRETRDVKTGLYPFQTAAAAASPKTTCGRKRKRVNGAQSLDTIYKLLREDPMQVRWGA